MKSMTGYARLEESINGIDYTIEIKSYNNRFLDVAINAPQNFSCYEGEIRALIASYCRRGKIEINIGVQQQNGAGHYGLNGDMLISYIELCDKIQPIIRKAGLKLNKTINLLDFISPGNAAGSACQSPLSKENFAAFKPVFVKALEELNKTREREGDSTKKSILRLLRDIESALNGIKARSDEIEELIKSNIKKRVAELNVSEVNENRMSAEVAFLLMKWTIAEEVSRLETHIALFKEEAENNPAPGKKLDFLSQEMMREINTIGSKTPLAESNCLTVSMKENIENIREQLRNVE